MKPDKIEDNYEFIAAVLKQQGYAKPGRQHRGIVRRFLKQVTATSRAQLTRLIARWMEGRAIRRKPARRPKFP